MHTNNMNVANSMHSKQKYVRFPGDKPLTLRMISIKYMKLYKIIITIIFLYLQYRNVLSSRTQFYKKSKCNVRVTGG